MGITKQYLRYVPCGVFNIITSQNCNINFVTLQSEEGRFVAVGACEHVYIWDLRLGEKVVVLPGEKSRVSCLCFIPNKKCIAVGYADGNIHVYNIENTEIVCIFSGHRSEITALAYDGIGHKLASGSKDTDVIVWDTITESGICRLSGHKGSITQFAFMTNYPILITASKDTFVKFWDLETQHCFKTLIGHHTEVWSLLLMKNDTYLVTACSDAELRIWKLTERDPDFKNKNSLEHLSNMLEIANLETDDDLTHPIQCHKVGSLLRSGRGRVVSMYSDPSGHILGCHGTDSQIELFLFCTDEEAQLRLKKRLKKQRKKEKKDTDMETDENEVNTENVELSLKDEVQRLPTLKLSSKLKSFSLILGRAEILRIVSSLADNSLHLHSLNIKEKNSEFKCLRTIVNQGHRSDVRAVAFSSDNLGIVSGSGETVKLWNRPSQVCLRTIQTGYVLSVLFVPGDRHVLVGLKTGKLLITDIASGDILEEIPAHTKELWSICLQPDMRGCVTGADHTVKFWNFELIIDENSETKAKVLSLVHTRTLQLEDVVLCVKISPNGKFIAVALLDSTVKIFFIDTFKFYLSLYGHKLPVLCMDISSDSTLIVTGSADRSVKIWGMDFGDCHKSLLAHEDSVTGLQFVHKTHYFFTCGKDGKVKQWDGDSFNKIITLHGHNGEAWSLAVSPSGQYLVSSGSDKTLRMYEKSDQMLVLQDEEEEEREEQEQLATGDETTVPGIKGVSLPSKKTLSSERGAESILECLEVSRQYDQQVSQEKVIKTVPPLMQAFNVTTTDDFLLETLKRIRTSNLEEALLLLPFSTVTEILQKLPNLIKRGDQTELILKLTMFLLKIHHKPIVASQELLPTLKKIQKLAMIKINGLRDMIGYNLFGLQLLQREIEYDNSVQLFMDATIQHKSNDKKRKKREKLKRAIITLS
ncbi:WD repeat-containing protein 3 [Agrilus planipennis]|uniref:WD repeat-containing protein 3 n=1 Tax=Agrilus planipennis TaxID=224129 RepID=A0A1W4X783_AGRPL|nr:WD repeat-containing protein 3 [Agrilus planipennis]XP_018331901.1 WD repeat-containing protein 3 [Agrilus planipennis]